MDGDHDEIVVERHELNVMFKSATDDQAEITRAWAELEAAVGSLRGRKFYGAFDPHSREYRACVETREGDDAGALRLEEGTLPGGLYARARVEGEPPGLYSLIRPAFDRLAERPDRDPQRPSLEYYRRHDVVELLLPVL